MAEWHQVADAESNLYEGDIVAIGCDARITRLDAARARCLVQLRKQLWRDRHTYGSTDAASKVEPSRPQFDTVAYCGRFQCECAGLFVPVIASASGLDDGTGVSASDVDSHRWSCAHTAATARLSMVCRDCSTPRTGSYRSGSRRLATVLSVVCVSFWRSVRASASLTACQPSQVCLLHHQSLYVGQAVSTI